MDDLLFTSVGESVHATAITHVKESEHTQSLFYSPVFKHGVKVPMLDVQTEPVQIFKHLHFNVVEMKHKIFTGLAVMMRSLHKSLKYADDTLIVS